MRETLTRVWRSYRFSGGDVAAELPSLPASTSAATDCDFDPDVWDRGERHGLLASGIRRVVLSRLPASDEATLTPTRRRLPTWRAVIDMPNEADRTALAFLHVRGVRGIRYDLGAAGSDGLARLLKLAELLVPFDWHVEIRLGAPGAARMLAKAEWQLLQFPLAVCFSGLAFRPGRHADAADLKYLLELVQLGRYWLRVSADELASPQLKLWDEVPPLAPVLQTMRKDRLIWGSGRQRGADSAAHLALGLALLQKCLPHPADRQQVLIDNPARLFGSDRN